MHLSYTLDILEKMLTGLQLSLEDFDFFLKAGATSANFKSHGKNKDLPKQ